jgi:hypothetical protein
MLLFEEYAAVLLTVHAIVAFLSVALSTHLALWLWKYYCRGQFGKRKAIVRFSMLSAAAYATTMLVGMAVYPTYKVRVRAEFLENPSRIHRSTEVEVQARKLTREQDLQVRRYRSSRAASVPEAAAELPTASPEETGAVADAKVERAAKLARWFDVKEHWALLGLLLSLAACGILSQWKPDKESRGIAKSVTALAAGAACIAWTSTLIGLSTAAARGLVAL